MLRQGSEHDGARVRVEALARLIRRGSLKAAHVAQGFKPSPHNRFGVPQAATKSDMSGGSSCRSSSVMAVKYKKSLIIWSTTRSRQWIPPKMEAKSCKSGLSIMESTLAIEDSGRGIDADKMANATWKLTILILDSRIDDVSSLPSVAAARTRGLGRAHVTGQYTPVPPKEVI
jgi:hypothetical protein